jgi:hypothetical protein
VNLGSNSGWSKQCHVPVSGEKEKKVALNVCGNRGGADVLTAICIDGTRSVACCPNKIPRLGEKIIEVRRRMQKLESFCCLATVQTRNREKRMRDEIMHT